jgi:hypothetical protein
MLYPQIANQRHLILSVISETVALRLNVHEFLTWSFGKVLASLFRATKSAERQLDYQLALAV